MRALKGREASAGRRASPRSSRRTTHAGAGRRERLHHALDRLRIDLTRHAEKRAQAREPARAVRGARREGALLRDRGLRPVHVRLRRRRQDSLPGHGKFNIDANYDAVRLFGADALPRHADLVRDEEGEPHRLLRLGEIRPGKRRLSPGADDRRGAAARAYRRLQDFYSPSSIARRFPWTGGRNVVRMVDLQSLHEEGLCDRPQGRDRRRRRPSPILRRSAVPAGQARVARRGAGGDRRVRGELFQRAAKRSWREGVVPIHLPQAAAAPGHAQAPYLRRSRAQSFQP